MSTYVLLPETTLIKQFEDIAQDNMSGATELIHRLLGVCEAGIITSDMASVEKGLQSLTGYQSGMPSFHAVLHTLHRDLVPLLKDKSDVTQALAYLASLEQLLDESVTSIGAHFVSMLIQAKTILTMSRSRTVISSVFEAHEKKLITHLYVMESRPMFEGVNTIRDSSERNIPATLITDAAMGEAVQLSDCVIVGADGISADGFLLNKTGSFALALVSAQLKKPFYVLCDSLKFSPQLRKDIMVEDHPASEVLKTKRSDHFQIWNRYFDWTPIDYVTAFITEKGIFPPDQITQLFTS